MTPKHTPIAALLLLAGSLMLPAAALAADHATHKAEASAPKLAAAQATQPLDPVDQLRQRLAERLSGAKPKAAPAEPAGDVQVLVKSAAAAPAATWPVMPGLLALTFW